jgi:hypothetical protein
MTKDNVQEPVGEVGTMPGTTGFTMACFKAESVPVGTKLYTTQLAAQRQWQSLTDEAIWSEYQTLWPFHPAEEPGLAKDIAKFARAIETKLREKNAASSLTIPDALTRYDCEGPEYTSGWNDCRAEILKGMK